MIRFTSFFAIVVLVLSSGGCSSFQKPTASFKSATIGEVTAQGLTLNVDVDIQNPNKIALPLSNADYSIALGGIKVVDGAKIKPGGSVPAGGSTTIHLPIPVTFENLLAAEEAIRKGGGDVKYGLDAGLDFESGVPVLGTLRVPFSHEGNLPVKELLNRNWSTFLMSSSGKKLAEKVMGAFKF